MAEWEGKSKGTPLGYKIFIFIINKIGTSAAYLLLYPVVAYYLVFSTHSNRAIKDYFSRLKAFSQKDIRTSLFRTYYNMGQALIDKIAIISDSELKFDIHREGMANLKAMDVQKTGGFLIGAHMGNWEIAGHLMKLYTTPVNIVLLDGEEEQIKNVMDNAMGARHFKTIPIKEDMSHIFKIHEAARNKEFICIHGDRFLPGSKSLEANFLGSPADFPAGPFVMASKLGLPVSFVYGMKESSTQYHFYCTKPILEATSKSEILKRYIHQLEEMVTRYPNQWFNFYPFWKSDKK
ncbi:lipid A biosynthesis acyltransferase [Owenweeksia hongkongensis]|uniref:LpxL/LpxP family acyltransferase n=1 Tax=Owenweeksia hongkongensis TaxID=253245 RepID=UPI003A8D987B